MEPTPSAERPTLIIHIGMGKTGSTSIQSALAGSRDHLGQQGAQYLGMWFNIVDPAYQGARGRELLFTGQGSQATELGSALGKKLREVSDRQAVDRFIISNEEFFGHPFFFKDFCTGARDYVNIRAIAYYRSPRKWLPSAYMQWAVHHKVQYGRVQPFSEFGSSLVRIYGGFSQWRRFVGSELEIRNYELVPNIVDDFLTACGIHLPQNDVRVQKRLYPSEAVFRYLFNDLREESALPDEFDSVFGSAFGDGRTSLQAITNAMFDYSSVDSIIERNKEIFSELEGIVGEPILQGGGDVTRHPISVDALRDEVLDLLALEFVKNVERLARLEHEVKEMKAHILRLTSNVQEKS